MVLKYALIDADNIIRNVIDYDGSSQYKPPAGLRLQQVESWLDIGHNANDPEPPPPPFVPESQDRILADLAAHRYAIQNSSVVINTHRFKTDAESRLALLAVFSVAATNSAFKVNWKMSDGTFVTLDQAGILAAGQGVLGFVQACFDAEKTLRDNVANYTTSAAINADFDKAMGGLV